MISYCLLHLLGKPLGILAYYLIPKYRKRALSNLALARDLDLSPKEIRRIAKASLQSLAITCLEYPKLYFEKDITNIARCINPEKADAIMQEGKGVIFFCGHQANWELLFLEGTSRMPGVAIGRPIKNKRLYNWVISIRQKFGGKIIPPKNAIKEGLRALKNGAFLGIVGDQGMPDSGFSSPFLGRKAWTSPMPALLSYKTNTPIIVATTKRRFGIYEITYSDPIYPNLEAPKEEEIARLMNEALKIYEESIKKCPEEWLWIHNRWKQQLREEINLAYRYDSLAIILPDDPILAEKIPLFRTLYPHEQITLYHPASLTPPPIDADLIPYTDRPSLKSDLRPKLLFNFTKHPIKSPTAQATYHLKTIDENLLEKVRNA